MIYDIHRAYSAAYSNPDSAVEHDIYGKTWVLYFSPIPREGSRIALTRISNSR